MVFHYKSFYAIFCQIAWTHKYCISDFLVANWIFWRSTFRLFFICRATWQLQNLLLTMVDWCYCVRVNDKSTSTIKVEASIMPILVKIRHISSLLASIWKAFLLIMWYIYFIVSIRNKKYMIKSFLTCQVSVKIFNIFKNYFLKRFKKCFFKRNKNALDVIITNFSEWLCLQVRVGKSRKCKLAGFFY